MLTVTQSRSSVSTMKVSIHSLTLSLSSSSLTFPIDLFTDQITWSEAKKKIIRKMRRDRGEIGEEDEEGENADEEEEEEALSHAHSQQSNLLDVPDVPDLPSYTDADIPKSIAQLAREERTKIELVRSILLSPSLFLKLCPNLMLQKWQTLWLDVNGFVRQPTQASLDSLHNVSNALEEILQDIKSVKQSQDLISEESFIPRYKPRSNEENNVPGHLVAVSYLTTWNQMNYKNNCSVLPRRSSSTCREQ